MRKGCEIIHPPPVNDPDHIHIEVLTSMSVRKRTAQVLELKHCPIWCPYIGYVEGTIKR